MTDLCWLLSFLSGSPVRPNTFQYGPVTSVNRVEDVAAYFRPVVDIRDGAVAQTAIQTMWAGFQAERDRRQLLALFHYLNTADAKGQPIEVKLLLAFVALENLKATYASSKGIPYAAGYFRKVSTPPKARLDKESRWGFKELLDAMLAEVTMVALPKSVVDLRNEIVHFGLSAHPATTLVAELFSARSTISEYLLRLMGYRGEFVDWPGSRNLSPAGLTFLTA